MTWELFKAGLLTFFGSAAKKIVVAVIVFLIGRAIIHAILKFVAQDKVSGKVDPTVRSFMMNFIKIGLYVILAVSIIGVLGVPMASVITVLASAGVAVGLALQGALGNLAGGLMLLIFRPFSVGDYIESAGASGVVKEINIFYTVIVTLDNVRITVPNGTLMNANVSNFSAESDRRVDLVFSCGKGEDIDKVCKVMLDVMKANPKVLDAPEAPFARLSGGTNEAMEFTARAWTKGANYWDVYFDLTGDITAALGEAGVSAPAVRVVTQQAK